MKVILHYETDPLDGEHQNLDVSFDGIELGVYDEFMDEYDKKDAIQSMRSVLNIYENKIDPLAKGRRNTDMDAFRLSEALGDILVEAMKDEPNKTVISTYAYTALKAYRENKGKEKIW